MISIPNSRLNDRFTHNLHTSRIGKRFQRKWRSNSPFHILNGLHCCPRCHQPVCPQGREGLCRKARPLCVPVRCCYWKCDKYTLPSFLSLSGGSVAFRVALRKVSAPSPRMSSGVSTQAGVEIAQLAGEAGFIAGTAFTMIGITLVVSLFLLLFML